MIRSVLKCIKRKTEWVTLSLIPVFIFSTRNFVTQILLTTSVAMYPVCSTVNWFESNIIMLYGGDQLIFIAMYECVCVRLCMNVVGCFAHCCSVSFYLVTNVFSRMLQNERCKPGCVRVAVCVCVV